MIKLVHRNDDCRFRVGQEHVQNWIFSVSFLHLGNTYMNSVAMQARHVLQTVAEYHITTDLLRRVQFLYSMNLHKMNKRLVMFSDMRTVRGNYERSNKLVVSSE